ncbi:creatininase family protein [Sphingobacterium sp. BN32]|uniref:creatininase family protein n=1 Tax=Sphingobacterium sp. BN32 TaxID=3058432 RepID=UPI00265CD281|nr:creatininase family protein [Sphingobacterium sp. BN32]WKK57804.1 creatininase family protein [Sphingobacterium sp. BN32]
MRYELMIPTQIRKAIADNIPVVLPLGVLEYHGEHLCTGVDTLVITETLAQLENEVPFIILPAFYYGAASYAVEGPEANGSIHNRPDILYPFASSLFMNLLRIGFRNIHVIVHHQSENFAAGMPTDLSFKLAARQTLFDFIERQFGEGWWGKAESANYYEGHEEGDNPFNWIQAYPLLSDSIQKDYPIDHAGKLETALMMAVCPEGVYMDHFSEDKWYTQTAKDASLEYGEAVLARVKDHLKDKLKPKS